MFLDRMKSNPQPSCCEAAAAITAPQEITPLKKTKTFILLECRFCKIPWTIWINKWSLMATFVQINFYQEQKDLNNGKSCLKHRLSRLIMLQTVFESCYLLMERQALLQLFFSYTHQQFPVHDQDAGRWDSIFTDIPILWPALIIPSPRKQ